MIRRCPSLLLLATLAACGPGLSDSGSDTDVEETSSDTDESTDTDGGTETPGTDGSVDPTDDWDPPEICPCERIEPEVVQCLGGAASIEDQLLEPASILDFAEGFTGRAVVLDDAVYVVVGSTESTVQRWVPGAEEFETVVSFDEPVEIEGLAVDGGALWLLTRAQTGDGALLSWSPEAGLDEVAAMPEMRAELAAWWRWDARLRVGHGTATFALADESVSGDATFTYPLATVDLATGSLTQGSEAVAGYAPSAQGVSTLRASIDQSQYCHDFACLSDDVATAWMLSDAENSVTAQNLCVGRGSAASLVINAWTTDTGDYIYVTGGVVQRALPDGSAESLWSSDAEIVEAVMDGNSLLVSTHNEGENELLEVPVGGGAPQRLFQTTSDHPARTIRIAGTIDDVLYIGVPTDDATELTALARV